MASDMELRAAKCGLRRLGDETRCAHLLGMAIGTIRCGLPKDHSGDHWYGDPSAVVLAAAEWREWLEEHDLSELSTFVEDEAYRMVEAIMRGEGPGQNPCKETED